MKQQSRGVVAVLVFTLAVSLVVDQSVSAQATAQLRGTIRDESGAVLPGVDVTATQTDTGLVRSVVSDGTGAYLFTNLPVGPYRLDVTLAGFRTFQQTGIVLQVGGSPTINVTMNLGALSETVTVQGEAPLVDTQRAGVGSVIENERILELPLNGRNAADLVTLIGAAVQIDSASTRSFQGSSGGVGIAVAGGQSFGTAYLLDGAMHNNPYDNLNLPLPFPDALQEFRVETGALGSGSGVHSGASVNAVTKSGSNRFTGDVFEFWRNHRFNAASPFASVGPDGKRQDDGLNRNQYGGTIGGPVRRDKLFFFAGYQGTTIRQTPTDNISFVPSAAMLAGDFTQIASTACRTSALTLRGPFVGNRVNPALFSPAAVALTKRLQSTTDPCGEVVYGAARNTDEGQFVGRMDLQMNSDHNVFGRYIITGFDTPPALANSDNLLTSTLGGFDNLGQSFTLGETSILSSSTVNAVRFAFNKTYVQRYHAPYFQASDLGIKVYSYLPDNFILSVTGGFNIGSGVPQSLHGLEVTPPHRVPHRFDILSAVVQEAGNQVCEPRVDSHENSVQPVADTFRWSTRAIAMLPDRLQQDLLLDWLRQVGRATRRHASFAIRLQGRGGKRDDRRGRPLIRVFPVSDRPRRGQTIHDRHLPVHQH
jgi:hypothetical protein